MNIRDLKTQILSEIGKAFEKAFSKKPADLCLVFPPDVKFGDFSAEFFAEAKNLKMSPAEAAKKVEEELKSLSNSPFEKGRGNYIEKVEAAGPYLNIKIKDDVLFGAVLNEIDSEKEKYGNSEIGQGKKVMVEYLSPNTNKPLHLGHARNGAIGMALAKILETQGYEVIKANLINDRGVHISKSMLAWQKWGNGETPESSGMKGDHFVGKYYVRYAIEAEKNPELEQEVQDLLKKWEAGDEETIKIWKLMNGWVYEGFEMTYKEYGFQFDEIFYESDTYKLGKDIISEGLEKGVFEKDKTGSVVFDLPEDEFGRDKKGELKKQTVLRADGTSVYMTQDIGTAVQRFQKFKLDKLIYIVGNEQIFHFQVLFKILESLGYSWAKKVIHYSYGMINLPEGKMKSREGKVVDADDLLLEVEKIVADEIKKRNPDISDADLKNRSKIIALGAIKFHLLRVRPAQDMEFDPKESVAIDGFTGPYCQYAYARISGILRNAKSLLNPPLGKGRRKSEVDYSVLGNREELELIQKLIQFQDALAKAGEELNPLRIITSVHEISQAFNLFYNNHQVLEKEDKKITFARIELVRATGAVIKSGLNLLGIEVLEKM